MLILLFYNINIIILNINILLCMLFFYCYFLNYYLLLFY